MSSKITAGEHQPAETRAPEAQVLKRARRTGWFVLGGLLVALVLAAVVSNYASADPDGLDCATLQGCTLNDEGEIVGGNCVALAAKDHELAGSPLSDYSVRGVGNGFLATGLSGVIGVLLTFAVGGGVFWLVRGRRTPAASADRADR